MVLPPQNGDGIATTDMTSLHPMYNSTETYIIVTTLITTVRFVETCTVYVK